MDAVARPTSRWADLASLTKAPLAAMVSLTAAAAHLQAAGRWSLHVCQPALGVFLLAVGAAALNQCQDSPLDARMKRTRNRPIPAGRLDRGSAVFLSLLLLLAGCYVLVARSARPMAVLVLGGLAVGWYNGVYAYLKRLTAFAVIPGALVGAIAPAIGWLSGGGRLADDRLALLGGFYFVWQIPHFWLLALIHGDDYAAAALPTPARLFAPAQQARITFAWIAAAGAVGALLPVGLGLPWPAGLCVVANSAWLILSAGLDVLSPGADLQRHRRALTQVNRFALVATCIVGACA